MGCGISRFDPKEVVEATTNCPHNPPQSYHKPSYSASNCFTGESKPLVHQGPPPPPDQKMMKMEQGEAKEINDNPRTRTQFKDDCSDDDSDGNDQNCREICRGGSPSFREYCIDSESRSRSMASEDDECEGDHCKWPPIEGMLNSENEKGVENEIGRKERRGKAIRNALQRGKSIGVKSLLSASRRQQNTNFTSPNHDTSHQLLAKPS